MHMNRKELYVGEFLKQIFLIANYLYSKNLHSEFPITYIHTCMHALFMQQ